MSKFVFSAQSPTDKRLIPMIINRFLLCPDFMNLIFFPFIIFLPSFLIFFVFHRQKSLIFQTFLLIHFASLFLLLILNFIEFQLRCHCFQAFWFHTEIVLVACLPPTIIVPIIFFICFIFQQHAGVIDLLDLRLQPSLLLDHHHSQSLL